MSILTQSPLAPLLDQLFIDAEASRATLGEQMATVSPGEFGTMMASTTGYRDFYTRVKDHPLAVSRETGALLYMLARASRAHSIVEFGTSFGISTLHSPPRSGTMAADG